MKTEINPFDDFEAEVIEDIQANFTTEETEIAKREQKSREWFFDRLGKFTGSAIHKLMGVTDLKKDEFSQGSMTYIYSIINERLLNESDREGYVRELMNKEFKQTSWGNDNEKLAIKEFVKKTDLMVEDVVFKTNENYPHMGGTTDGKVSDGTYAEVKCPYDGTKHLANFDLFNSDDFDEIGKHEYYTQVQHHCLNNNAAGTWFISFNPRVIEPYNFVCKFIPRDEDYINVMLRRINLAETAINLVLKEKISLKSALRKSKELAILPGNYKNDKNEQH